jgi:hypothetical protein
MQIICNVEQRVRHYRFLFFVLSSNFPEEDHSLTGLIKGVHILSLSVRGVFRDKFISDSEDI